MDEWENEYTVERYRNHIVQLMTLLDEGKHNPEHVWYLIHESIQEELRH